ncbi:MAG: lipopolysaccharide heptosyltransferase family protein, partial [Gammaproteobacteria bacterium]|nr:lipopolysaccharide heptosyltransferase family protein [Gammaproteobacteria bacterium]
KYSSIITLFSTTRIGFLSLLSGIKYRIAPASKIAQFFYNHKLVQQRSKSLKPEYEYNLDLAKQFLADHGYTPVNTSHEPLLSFTNDDIRQVRNEFYTQYKLDTESKLIFIHPGTGGSATNLDLEQYATLAKNLNINDNYTFVITAGPNELEYANKLSLLLKNIPHIVYPSTKGLVNFAKIIQLCEIFIGGSTGPLHIAGALNRPTAAFYQRRRSATPLRWQTLNSEDRRLAFTPPENEHESDMQKIDVIEAANKINDKFLKF